MYIVILLTVGCLKSFSSSPGKSMIIFRSWTSWLGVNIGKEYGVLSYGKKKWEKAWNSCSFVILWDLLIWHCEYKGITGILFKVFIIPKSNLNMCKIVLIYIQWHRPINKVKVFGAKLTACLRLMYIQE